MPRKRVIGECCLCGNNTFLSFEHVPPKSAFNDRPVLRARLEEIIHDLDTPRGLIEQRGSGDYTLCDPCNNLTGRWYGSAFCDWVLQAMRLWPHMRRLKSIYHTYDIFPLRVIKQVVCMFFSANGTGFRGVHPDLQEFVLNKRKTGMDPKIQIFAYLTSSDRSRSTGIAAAGNFTGVGRHQLLSEIAFPPVGYVMTIDSDPPDPRLVDVSFFAKYGFSDRRSVSLELSVLPVYTFIPGDYRDRDTAEREAAESRNRM